MGNFLRCARIYFSAKPHGMEFDAENKVYYKQYYIDYEVRTQTGTKKADRLRLNLFFDPTARGEMKYPRAASLTTSQERLVESVADPAKNQRQALSLQYKKTQINKKMSFFLHYQVKSCTFAAISTSINKKKYWK